MDNDIAVIEQHLATLTPEEREATKARMREVMLRCDEEAREREHQRLRDLVTAREAAGLALIAACEALKPLMATFDEHDLWLRRALPTLCSTLPQVFRWSLPSEIVAVNLSGARSQLDAFRAQASEAIAKTGR